MFNTSSPCVETMQNDSAEEGGEGRSGGKEEVKGKKGRREEEEE